MDQNISNNTFKCMLQFDIVLRSTLLLEGISTLIFALLTSTLNAICCICLIKYCKAMPNAIRLLVLNISVAYTVRSMYLIYKSISNIAFSINPDKMVSERLHCIIEMVLYVVLHFVNQLSLFWLGIDRLYVTTVGNSMVSRSSNKSIVLKIVFIWILSTLMYIGCTCYGMTGFHEPICFCQVSSATPGATSYKLLTFPLLVIQMVTCLIYTLIQQCNRYRLSHFDRPKNQNLNNRYTMWSDFSAARWLLLVTIFHSIVSSLNLMTSVLNNLLKTDANSTIFLGITFSIYLIFAVDHLAHPIICVRYSTDFKSAVVKLFNKRGSKFFNRILCLFFGIMIDEQSGALVDPRKNETKLITVSSQTIAMNRILDGTSRSVVRHNLDPENQNELLHNIWSKAKVNHKRK